MGRLAFVALAASIIALAIVAGISNNATLPSGTAPIGPPTGVDAGMGAGAIAGSELVQIGGAIERIGNGKLHIRTKSNKHDGPVEAEVVAVADDSTVVTIQRLKDPAEWQAEIRRYDAASDRGLGVLGPVPFIVETGNISDLAPGMLVIVTPARGTKANETQFRAAAIRVVIRTPTGDTQP